MIIRTLTQLFKKPYNCEQYHFNYRKMSRVQVLNVAEKNDAAKNIAQLLSRGRSQRVSISPKDSLYDHDMYYASNIHSHSFLKLHLTLQKEGLSKFNKIYEFQCDVEGHLCDMRMTSVSGHLTNFDFEGIVQPFNAFIAFDT